MPRRGLGSNHIRPKCLHEVRKTGSKHTTWILEEKLKIIISPHRPQLLPDGSIQIINTIFSNAEARELKLLAILSMVFAESQDRPPSQPSPKSNPDLGEGACYNPQIPLLSTHLVDSSPKFRTLEFWGGWEGAKTQAKRQQLCQK